MSIEVKVPNLPESVSEATVADWHKQAGDKVSREENLVDLETDKVMLEVPSTANGVLKEIKVKAGDTVQEGDVLAILEEGESGGDAKAAKSSGSSSKSAKQDEADDDGDDEGSKDGGGQQSPAVRKLLAEHDLDAGDIKGSGKGGRLTKADVEAHLKNAGSKSEKSEKSGQSKDKSGGDSKSASAPAAGAREEQRVPMSRIRARIAERLVEAQSTAAMLTTFNEVNLKPLMDARKQYKEMFEKSHGVKLGIMSFFVKAAVEALKRYPIINASVDGDDIVYHGYYDIGIAVSAPRGLVVPILRDVDAMSYADVEKAIVDFGTRAKDNKLSMDDLTGGTFSITNGGVFGSMMSTPILNPPQSAILGMHGTTERPVVENGEIVIRPMMYLALTYDHRIIDGRDAVLFLRAIKDGLEDPARLLLGV